MLEKIKKKRKPQGIRGLQIFCCVFLLGYLLFFSTGFILPKHYKNVDTVPIGSKLELGDYTLTLDSWEWAQKDKSFELIFDVKDISLEREADYSFIFRSGDSRYRYKIYRNLGDLLVVRVSGVNSRFTQVNMTVEAGGSSKAVTMDDRSMTRTDRLTERTDAEYRIRAAEGKIEGYQTCINRLAVQQEEKTADIEYAYEKLAALEQSKANQTDRQQEALKADIRTLSGRQAKLQNELEDIMLQKQELESELSQQQALLEQMKGGEIR